MRILIVGGGASGLMAALTASENAENEVVLIERQARVGRKLLATGNGRCNLTNRLLGLEHYHGQEPDFCFPALHAFDAEQTLAFFRELGLLTVTQPDGRVYPYSDSANSVLDVLRLHLEQRENLTILTACEVSALRKKQGRFCAQTGEATVEAERAIVCAGGIAGGKLGGTDAGYRLLSSFGHRRTRLTPALVQLRTDTTFVRALKGVRCEAEAAFAGKMRRGEVQFTDYGVSGPVIFELSGAAEDGTLTLDFLPDYADDEIFALLRARCDTLPKLKAESLLTGMLHNRLGKTLLRVCGLPAEEALMDLDDAALHAVVRASKRFSLTVTGKPGFDGAQVTSGGIRTTEFDSQTLESRLCPGLYAAGEVLDIDGDCGGYNLQWAWSSGRLAGKLRSKQ